MSRYATIAKLTDDRVVYRDLEPCDPGLPGLQALYSELGIAPGFLPRKRHPAYAQAIATIAATAQAQRGGLPLQAFVVIGDSENDRLLAQHLRNLPEGIPAYGFIGEDRPVAEATLSWDGDTATATRWSFVHQWAAELERRQIDWARTALLIDIDKALLGPRGRSDGAIDDSRAEGALMIANRLAGNALDVRLFRRIYMELCRKEWHSFTLDNQDYVVFTALLLTTGAYELEALREDMLTEEIADFLEFLDRTAPHVIPPLAALHQELRERVAAGDPTPFKEFRRAEFVATVDRMQDGRLTLCGDLFDLSDRLIEQGALCIAASDKPAEAVLPSAAQRAAGMLPLHHIPARID